MIPCIAGRLSWSMATPVPADCRPEYVWQSSQDFEATRVKAMNVPNRQKILLDDGTAGKEGAATAVTGGAQGKAPLKLAAAFFCDIERGGRDGSAVIAPLARTDYRR